MCRVWPVFVGFSSNDNFPVLPGSSGLLHSPGCIAILDASLLALPGTGRCFSELSAVTRWGTGDVQPLHGEEPLWPVLWLPGEGGSPLSFVSWPPGEGSTYLGCIWLLGGEPGDMRLGGSLLLHAGARNPEPGSPSAAGLKARLANWALLTLSLQAE